MDSEGSESRPQAVNTLSPEQTQISQAIGKYLLPYIGQSTAAYSGKMVADIPEEYSTAYAKLFSSMGPYADAAAATLKQDMEGKPAYTYDESTTAKRWQEGFAAPVMETWNRTLKPMIEQSFAGVPGGFYSADKGRSVRNQSQDFYSQYVMPTLYQSQESDIQRGFASGEAAAARKAPAAMALSGLAGQNFNTAAQATGMTRSMQQEGLDAAYSNWMSSQPYNSAWLDKGLSYMGIGTTGIGNKQDSWGNQLGYQWLSPTGVMSAAALGA